MQFTLPSLIATLMVAVLIGCGDKQTPLAAQHSGTNPAGNSDRSVAQSNIDVTPLAAQPTVEPTVAAEPSSSLQEPTANAEGNRFDFDSFTLPPSSAIPVSAQQPSPGERKAAIYAENCMVQYINKVNVPAKAEGTLMELKFEEGDTVSVGDVLAVIDDTSARLAVELKRAEEKEAELNGRNEVNLEDAVNAEELASAEYKAYEQLLRESAIPYWEAEKKRLEAERARLRIGLAEMQKKIAEVQYFAKRSEREIAEFELTRRQVTSPSTAFVEARIAQLGEWVQPGSPIATLIQMDRLRVEGDIAMKNDGQILRGTKVQVTINDSFGEPIKVLNGELGFVSMEFDLNNRLRVWVEIENEMKDGDWLIKPGMRAEIEIHEPGQVL
jgi:multidrug efflux pump subunit AcrA (membrane-fusion protein)